MTYDFLLMALGFATVLVLLVVWGCVLDKVMPWVFQEDANEQ